MDVVLSLLAGALGGNSAGAFLEGVNLGLARNSLAGLLGGLLAGQFVAHFDMVATTSSGSGGEAVGILMIFLAAVLGGCVATAIAAIIRLLATKR